MTSKQTERFQQRFGPAGALLSTALPDFPLDVLGLIAEFVMFGVAKKSKKPVLLFSLGLELSGKSDTPATAAKSEGAAVHEFKGASYAVACCPTTCRIWVASDVDVHVMSADGVFLRLAAQGRLASPVAVCFDRQHAYIVDTVLNRVNVCTLDGEWLRSFDHDRGFDAPWGIALHRQHDPPLLFVVDQAHHRICVRPSMSVLRLFNAGGRHSRRMVRSCASLAARARVLVSSRILGASRSLQPAKSACSIGLTTGFRQASALFALTLDAAYRRSSAPMARFCACGRPSAQVSFIAAAALRSIARATF